MKCYMTGKPCDHFREFGYQKHVFLLSPFGFPFDSLYAGKDAVVWQQLDALGYTASRADQTLRIGLIMCQSVCKQIIDNELMLADVSTPNANVYYELGLAYGLGRTILPCASENTTNRYLDLFDKVLKKVKMVRYRDILHLQELLRERLRDPAHMGREERAAAVVGHDLPNKEVLILENGDGGISGVYERILRELPGRYDFKDVLQSLSTSERVLFKKEEAAWRDWKARTETVCADSCPDDICQTVEKCKVCIVDTTAYVHNQVPFVNPYMYFCLGLAHGLEKEVIPITNTRHSEGAPFDVRGLRHIFFSKEEELKSGLANIMPKISVEYFKERVDAPRRTIWDSVLAGSKTLSIIYCGRPVSGQLRGSRTNIDSWDSRAVSEASFYLAQKYPTSQIMAAPPKTRLKEPGRDAESTIRGQLSDKYANCLIVGSPDNNDYAEVVLAEIYHKKPFMPSPRLDGRGFIFHKDYLEPDHKSSFYFRCKRNQNSVEFPNHNERITSDTTYGVLTIAKNPFAQDKGIVIVLSGFTGIATWGLMMLLIGTGGDADMHGQQQAGLKESVEAQLRELLRWFDPKALFDPSQRDSDPFTALVKFECKSHPDMEGDNRELTRVVVIEARGGP